MDTIEAGNHWKESGRPVADDLLVTNQNAQQARQDLYLFGAKQVLDVIQMTLSMTNVLPRNRFVEFDVEAYLYENNLAEVPVEEARDTEREEMYS